MEFKVEVGISNKHVHLSKADLAVLFGAEHKLSIKKMLKHHGEYAAEEQVDVTGPRGTLKNVRILGPIRGESQVELAQTDARTIGLALPVRESGVLDNTPGVKLSGPAGEIDLPKGAIIALRHVHLSPEGARDAGLNDRDWVTVKTFGTRPLVFEKVLVHVSEAFVNEMHIDTDEGNAAGLVNGDIVEITGKE